MKARYEIGTAVNGKGGQGIISKIITKSTGYVEVTYADGATKKEMAFNLTDMSGIALKATPKKREDSVKVTSHLESTKQSLMAINGSTQGDRNGYYRIWRNELTLIWSKASDVNNSFIESVCESVDKWMKVSEKQAFVLARFATENGISF